MDSKITICIICETGLKNYERSLSDFTGIASEFIIVNSGCCDSGTSSIHDSGIPVNILSEYSDNDQSLITSLKNSQGEWIFIFNANEMVPKDQINQLQILCDAEKASAYYVNIKKGLGQDTMGAYEWLGSIGRYSNPVFHKSTYIPCLEIRLFMKKHLLSFQSNLNGSIYPVLSPQVQTVPICDIQLKDARLKSSSLTDRNRIESETEDRNRFFAEVEENIDIHEKFPFLVRNAIGYSLVDKKDMPSLTEALKMGLGHVELLKFMVHNLIEEGEYKEAIGFADAILDKLGYHSELWRLKGFANFYLLNLDTAEECFERVLGSNAMDNNALINLSKIHILSNRFEKANQLLNQIDDLHGTTPEIDFIRYLIDQNLEQKATWSLLMLCRDEEKYIGRAFNSVSDIVDEIIIVDTGSQDQTINIALEYGATVVASQWENDFSKSRNEGLKRSTGDYILCMDADEYLDIDAKISLLVFKHLLAPGKKMAIILDIHTLTEENKINPLLPPVSIGKRTAIFPNLPGVCFQGKRYESVDRSLTDVGIERIVANNTPIKHNSDNAEFRKNRKEMTLKEAFTKGMDLSEIFQGVSYWIDNGHPEKSLRWLEQGIIKSKGAETYLDIIFRIVRYFKQVGILDTGSSLFHLLIDQYGHSYRMMTLCADLLVENKAFEQAFEPLSSLVDNQNRFDEDAPETDDLHLNRINFALAGIELDDLASFNHSIQLLSPDKEMTDTINALLFYHNIKNRDIDAAISILDSWIKDRHLKVKTTIHSFVDLLDIIAIVIGNMAQSQDVYASRILFYASEKLAESLTGKE